MRWGYGFLIIAVRILYFTLLYFTCTHSGSEHLALLGTTGYFLYFLLELRAYMCGTRVGAVVAESGGVATAISS